MNFEDLERAFSVTFSGIKYYQILRSADLNFTERKVNFNLYKDQIS